MAAEPTDASQGELFPWGAPEERLLLFQSIAEAADEAPTVEEALRAALARVCAHAQWQAGRLHLAAAAGELATRTFWHLQTPERLAAFLPLAKARRSGGGPAAEVLERGNPLWRSVAGEEAAAAGARAGFAFRVFGRRQIFAALEFFSASSEKPPEPVLEAISLVCAELGRILQRKPADEALRRSEREHRALFENAHDGILIVDPDGHAVLDANQRACELFGLSRGELFERSLEGVLGDRERRHRAELREVLQGTGLRLEIPHRRPDGAELILEIGPGPGEFRGGRAVGIASRDVTVQTRMLEALRASEERYRLLFESSPQPMWVFDRESLRFLAVNEAAVRCYGYSREEFGRLTVEEIGFAVSSARPDPDGREEGTPREAGAPSLWRHRKADGAVIDVEVTSHEIDFAGRKARLVVANDVTERLRAEEKLRHAAFYDALTGLPNRALFMERLGQAQARARRRGGAGFGVLFLDLDRFKFVNDSLGHRTGDLLLVQIARRLQCIRRSGDTVARLGGDEFSILVEGVHDADDAARVADRVQRELALPFDMEGQEVFMSASIGIALGGGPGSEQRAEDLLRDADTAMYRAKGQGSGTHAVFDSTMHDRAVAVLQLETDLRRALDRGELRVLYQPVVSLQTGRIVGFEALARWMHRLRGLIEPSEFIPLAEETGLIHALDRWVLREPCTRMGALQRQHPRQPALGFSVNLSGRELLQPDLADQVEGILRDTGVLPGSMRLEITETVLVENASQAARSLSRLRQLGLSLCIDDFGTGYSSLSYLHRMPIDAIKIDASFIHAMTADEKNRRIVEAIVMLGRNLGAEVVAEGVGRAAQGGALPRLGCALVQGFLYSEPLDLAGAAALLAAEAATTTGPILAAAPPGKVGTA